MSSLHEQYEEFFGAPKSEPPTPVVVAPVMAARRTRIPPVAILALIFVGLAGVATALAGGVHAEPRVAAVESPRSISQAPVESAPVPVVAAAIHLPNAVVTPEPKSVPVVRVVLVHEPTPVSTPKPVPTTRAKPAPVATFVHGNSCGVDTWHDSGPDHSYGYFADGAPGWKTTTTYRGKTGYLYRVPDQCKPWWHVSCGDESQLRTNDGQVIGTGFWGGQPRVPDVCDSKVPADRRWSNQPTGYYGAGRPMETQWKP